MQPFILTGSRRYLWFSSYRLFFWVDFFWLPVLSGTFKSTGRKSIWNFEVSGTEEDFLAGKLTFLWIEGDGMFVWFVFDELRVFFEDLVDGFTELFLCSFLFVDE
jgi:hypothetical protein